MQLSEEQRCLLWLSAGEISSCHVRQLKEKYGSAAGIWKEFGRADGPQFQSNASAVLTRLHSSDAMDDYIEYSVRKKIKFLFEDDENYPFSLLSIQDPPYLLYYAGKLDCFGFPMIAIVGSRKASRYGEEMSALIAKQMSEAGVTVVSGLARGIDAAAHQAVLACGGRTIGVLGSGINVPYPKEHTQMLRDIAGGSGLILSEFPIDSGPVQYHFPHRNRVISGLSMGVVFVEGRIKSGGMLTVNTALMQGREVFAVPGRVGTDGAEGPNIILREGARIVTSGMDVLEDLGLLKQSRSVSHEKEQIQLNLLQTQIVALLQSEPMTASEISVALSADIDSLLSELGILEIMGVIVKETGNRFHLPVKA